MDKVALNERQRFSAHGIEPRVNHLRRVVEAHSLQMPQERMHGWRPRAAVANNHIARPVHRGRMKSAFDAQDLIWLRHVHSNDNLSSQVTHQMSPSRIAARGAILSALGLIAVDVQLLGEQWSSARACGLPRRRVRCIRQAPRRERQIPWVTGGSGANNLADYENHVDPCGRTAQDPTEQP